MVYMQHPELWLPEEHEDHAYKGNSHSPEFPPLFKKWYMYAVDLMPLPEEDTRSEFEARASAMGLSLVQLEELLQHVCQPNFLPVQKRRVFRMLQHKMLQQLIPSSGCTNIEALIDVLKQELVDNTPAPVPTWYVFSKMVFGPRRIGYNKCFNRPCYQSEDQTHRFSNCGQCKWSYYCSPECQKADWKTRHRVLCKETSEEKGLIASVSKKLMAMSKGKH